MTKEQLKKKLINEFGVTFKGDVIRFPKNAEDYSVEFLAVVIQSFKVEFIMMMGNMPLGIQLVRINKGRLQAMDITDLTAYRHFLN